MSVFRDNQGREWTVEIDVSTVRRVRDYCELNLYEVAPVMESRDGKHVLVRDSAIKRLSDDIVLLCDVLYCICKPQADKVGISDEEFGRGLRGDAIDEASKALLEEIVSFFPKGRREVLQRCLTASGKLTDFILSDAHKALDEAANILERARLKSSSGNLQDSSASIPAD